MSAPKGGARLKGRVGAFLIVLALSIAWGCLAATPAMAAATAHITGHVTDAVTGDPITTENINVRAYLMDGSDRVSESDVMIDDQGTYDIGELSAGTYVLQFFDYGQQYAPQYYSGKAALETADRVTVASGATVSDRNVALVAGSHITGHVTDAATGDPLYGIEVQAYGSDGEDDYWFANASTDDEGNYDISGLLASTYTVEFSDWSGAYLPEYYDGQSDGEAATEVIVGAASTISDIDASLNVASHITGHVTDAATGLPISLEDEGITVYAYLKDSTTEESDGNADVDESGNYDMPGLAAGTYIVSFRTWEGEYLDQYYSGKDTAESANPVTVGTGVVVDGIDAALVAGSHITGHLTDAATHASIDGDEDKGYVGVTAYEKNGSVWDEMSSTSLDGSGNYDLHGLPAGSYVVAFSGEGWGSYATQYYSGKATRGAATPVTVGTAVTVPSINAALVVGSHIKGRLTDAAKKYQVVRGYATAYIKDGVEWDEENSARTDDTGYYDIRGLAAGTYHVGFVVVSGYETQFYNGTTTQNSAKDVTLGAHATVSGINLAAVPIAPDTLIVTPSSGGHGWLWPNKTMAVAAGDTQAFEIGPDDGYYISKVLVDGVSKGARESYTFSNVTTNHLLAVSFSRMVTTKLSITSNHTTVHRGHSVTFSGKISPNMSSGTHATVYIKKSGASAWTKLSTRHTYSSHHWSYTYKVPKSSGTGTYYVRVQYAGSAKYKSSHSSSRKLVIAK